MGGPWGTLSPRPPGIYRFVLAPARVWKGKKAGCCQPARPCRSQAPRSALGSHPCVALSPAGAKAVFPVSVTLGVYRAGNGKRRFQLVAGGGVDDLAAGREFGQGGADRSGAQAAALAQMLNRGRLLQLSQSLTDSLDGRWRGRLDW